MEDVLVMQGVEPNLVVGEEVRTSRRGEDRSPLDTVMLSRYRYLRWQN